MASTIITPSSNPTAGMIPMSIPAILINPKQKPLSNQIPRNSDRENSRRETPIPLVGGRRRQKRVENGLFYNNPHILRPTLKDYDPRPPSRLVPMYAPPLPSIYVPSTSSDSTNLNNKLSSKNGQFYITLTGIKKNLLKLTGPKRGEGGRIEEVLGIIESELQCWLEFPARNHRTYGSRIIDSTPIEIISTSTSISSELPDLPTSSPSYISSTPTTQPAIVEYLHTPSHLLWSIPDSHTRFLTHLIARYYSISSYSTSINSLPPSFHLAHSLNSTLDNNGRVTHFIRPAFKRPQVLNGGVGGLGGLDTPDATDLGSTTGGGTSSSNNSTTESGTETETESDNGLGGGGGGESDWEEVVREWVEVDGMELGNEEVERDELEYSEGEGYDGTDDEASSTGTGGEEGGFDSMESSLSELPPRTNLPFTTTSSTPTSNRTTNLEEILSSRERDIREGSATPRVLPRSSFGGRSGNNRRRSGATGGGGGGGGGEGYGGESSPSRSPERVEVRRETIREQRQDWSYPEKSFLDYLFER